MSEYALICFALIGWVALVTFFTTLPVWAVTAYLFETGRISVQDNATRLSMRGCVRFWRSLLERKRRAWPFPISFIGAMVVPTNRSVAIAAWIVCLGLLPLAYSLGRKFRVSFAQLHYIYGGLLWVLTFVAMVIQGPTKFKSALLDPTALWVVLWHWIDGQLG